MNSPAEAVTTPARKYAMTRLDSGDYLLPSNDAKTLWRLTLYTEDGSAEYTDRRGTTRQMRGRFWGVWRWDGGFPNFEQVAAALESADWTRWEFWAGPFSSRREAVEEALRVG